MAYAEIEDIEVRLGDTLSDEEAESLEVFLEDFSVFLDVEIEKAGKVIGTDAGEVKLAVLKIVVAQRGVNKHLSNSNPYGAASYSRAIGEVSESVSFSSSASGNNNYGDFWLSPKERAFIGIGNMDKFQNIEIERGW